MKFDYEKLGNLIEISETKNKDLAVTNLVGVNINKEFMPSVANTVGTNLANYKIIKKDQFVYNNMQVARDRTIRIVRYADETPSIISPAYKIFQVIDKNLLNAEFLMLYFLRPEFDRLCWFYTDSSIRGSLDWAKFCNLKVPVPPMDIQEKIVNIYNFINERIHLKNNINKNLLQLVKAIFQMWFVEFEPFNGSQPEDWKICSLEEVCDLNAGGDKPEIVSDEKTDSCIYPIYSNGLYKDGLYGYTNQAKIFEECVTVSARGTIGFVCLRHEPYVPIVRLISLIPNKEKITAKYLYLSLERLNILGNGTTQQQLTIPDFKRTEILVPTYGVIDSFTDKINPIFNQIWSHEKEIIILSNLRDTLLSKLMSGEIDLSKINWNI
ncbi:restriction endonuclease subunit S [Methanobrevibacter sp.]|uniref:restriction endonuclease subunit S n=1 Tax=Methanobrevibacter sp. TaxID=66852 RepID=UPI003867219C